MSAGDAEEASITTVDGERIPTSRLPSWMAVVPGNPHVEALRDAASLYMRWRGSGPSICRMLADGLAVCAKAVCFNSDYPPFDVKELERKVFAELELLNNAGT